MIGTDRIEAVRTKAGEARGIARLKLVAALALGCVTLAGCAGTPANAQTRHVPGTWENDYAFSPAVTTEGGRVIWVAGHHGAMDEAGNSLEGDFDAQVRMTFAEIEKTLAREGATLADIVSMTVYITDAAQSKRFTEIRKEYYPDGKYPASALVTVAGLALPSMMVEIQPVAVVAGE